MKIRVGFVSNSSSSSFVLRKSKLTAIEVDKIKNHIEWAKRLGLEMVCADEYNKWNVREDEEIIWLDTSMDNFDMSYFLYEGIQINPDAIISRDKF